MGFAKTDLMPHYIYCGRHGLDKMRKYGIQCISILTIDANEEKTQEKAKEAAEGK